MKAGTENRTKTILAGVFGACALIAVGLFLHNQLGGDDSPAPASRTAPVVKSLNANNAAMAEASTTENNSRSNSGNSRAVTAPGGVAAGVAATKMASTSASLDPTLDPSAMLRTEHLVYAGSGRNIFSAIYVPEPKKIEEPKYPVRPKGPQGPVIPVKPQPPPTCPPSCPPINLKFFGTATRANGVRQAFLLQGDDVFLASQGDIVARKYKIVSISANSIQVEDMANNNTQTLPLQSN
jgi:hypothetical protein